MRALIFALSAFILAGCGSAGEAVEAANGSLATSVQASNGRPFTVTPVQKFDEPWAMTFLPSGDFLVTEKKGRLYYGRAFGVEANGNAVYVEGVPKVDAGGQGASAMSSSTPILETTASSI